MNRLIFEHLEHTELLVTNSACLKGLRRWCVALLEFTLSVAIADFIAIVVIARG